MNRTRIAFSIAAGLGLLLFVALCWGAAPASASPAVQVEFTPRPGLTPTPVPAQKSPAMHPPRLQGSVLDWGKGNMPAGVKVILRGDGWQIPVETDGSGEYHFQDIGNEVAFLNAVIPDGRQELRPLTIDLPVRVQVDRQLIVNMALYPEGAAPESLVGIEFAASSTETQPGAAVSYVAQVTNRWDQQINQAIVADYLPEGLIYVSATASQGEIVYDRGLVWASLGSLDAGASAMVTIVAKVDPQASPGTTLRNQAAVYHSENVAVQAEAEIRVTEETNHVMPVTGTEYMLPLAGLLLTGLLLVARKLRLARG